MKKTFSIILLALLLSTIVGNCAIAESRASDAFKVTTIALTKNLYAEFRATTRRDYNEIKISSVTLQEMDGNKVVDSKTLTAPSTTATDTDMFVASADYQSEGTSGKSYRIKATFWADGYTVTGYSRTIDF